MSDPFVVKVQKSLTDKYLVLIYDVDHYIMHQEKVSKKLWRDLPEAKAYYWAIINDDKKIEIQGKPLPNNDETLENFENYSFKVMNQIIA